MIVYVLVDLEGGWDNVVGVYDSMKKAQDKLIEFGCDEEEVMDNDVEQYYIHEKTIQ